MTNANKAAVVRTKRAIVGGLPHLAAEIVAGRVPVEAERVPLAEVTAAWTREVPPERRVVLVP